MERNRHAKAILVGVSDYSGYKDTPDLECGINDLTLMEHALVHGIKINPLNIWIKTERKGFVTRDSFLAGIKLFLGDVGREDVLIFYFTGHGRTANGRHELLFSDGPLETQSLIDLFAGLGADKCILFLDCCMSGQYAVRNGNLADDFAIRELLAGGTAVFASSRPEELSGYHDQYPASLFTSFLWKSMTNRFYVKNGRLSLNTIVDLTYREAAAWNARHPDHAQHPVFRSSMSGTVYFDVADGSSEMAAKPSGRFTGGTVYFDVADGSSEMAVQPSGRFTGRPVHCSMPETSADAGGPYTSGHGDFIITSVSPLHSAKAKRYAVRAVLKHAVTPGALAKISREIIEETRGLEIFKTEKDRMRWEHRPADMVFIYFGESFKDIGREIYAYRVTWADENQDRTHWYRTDVNSTVLGDILVWTNPQYGLLRRFYDENEVNEEQAYAETAKLMRPLIEHGETCVHLYQEYRNGTISPDLLAEKAGDVCREMDTLYLALSDLSVPPAEMAGWSRMILCVAGDVQEFSRLFRQWLHEKTVADADMAEIMREAAERFYGDLEALLPEKENLMNTLLSGSAAGIGDNT